MRYPVKATALLAKAMDEYTDKWTDSQLDRIEIDGQLETLDFEPRIDGEQAADPDEHRKRRESPKKSQRKQAEHHRYEQSAKCSEQEDRLVIAMNEKFIAQIRKLQAQKMKQEIDNMEVRETNGKLAARNRELEERSLSLEDRMETLKTVGDQMRTRMLRRIEEMESDRVTLKTENKSLREKLEGATSLSMRELHCSIDNKLSYS